MAQDTEDIYRIVRNCLADMWNFTDEVRDIVAEEITDDLSEFYAQNPERIDDFDPYDDEPDGPLLDKPIGGPYYDREAQIESVMPRVRRAKLPSGYQAGGALMDSSLRVIAGEVVDALVGPVESNEEASCSKCGGTGIDEVEERRRIEEQKRLEEKDPIANSPVTWHSAPCSQYDGNGELSIPQSATERRGDGLFKANDANERPVPLDFDALWRVLMDPEAAIRALPEADQERYRDAIQSVVDARRAAEAGAHDVVLGDDSPSEPGSKWDLENDLIEVNELVPKDQYDPSPFDLTEIEQERHFWEAVLFDKKQTLVDLVDEEDFDGQCAHDALAWSEPDEQLVTDILFALGEVDGVELPDDRDPDQVIAMRRALRDELAAAQIAADLDRRGIGMIGERDASPPEPEDVPEAAPRTIERMVCPECGEFADCAMWGPECSRYDRHSRSAEGAPRSVKCVPVTYTLAQPPDRQGSGMAEPFDRQDEGEPPDDLTHYMQRCSELSVELGEARADIQQLQSLLIASREETRRAELKADKLWKPYNSMRDDFKRHVERIAQLEFEVEQLERQVRLDQTLFREQWSAATDLLRNLPDEVRRRIADQRYPFNAVQRIANDLADWLDAHQGESQ